MRPDRGEEGPRARLRASTPSCPPAIVGDAGRLRQIVLNLLSNAIKFTEQGRGRRCGRRRRRLDADGSRRRAWEIAVDVRDTGIGIPPDRMDRLFQSFSQADASIARRYGGTGLGLAISRRLAELMGGSLDAREQRRPGRGQHVPLMVRRSEADEAAGRHGAADAEREPPRLPGRSSSTTTRRTAGSLRRAARALGVDGAATASPREALALGRAPGAAFDVAMPRPPDARARRRGAGRGDPRGAAAGRGRSPVVILSSIGRHAATAPNDRGDARQAGQAVGPARCAGRRAPARPRRARPPAGRRRRRRRGPGDARIRSASCWPRTTPSTRSSPCGCSSGWATAADVVGNGLEARRRARGGRLRRRADGRPDAGAGRARGDAADPRALAGPAPSGSSR